jgi:hypothetical protein
MLAVVVLGPATSTVASVSTATPSTAGAELAVVDTTVTDHAALAHAAREAGMDVVNVSSAAELTAALSERSNLTAVHVLSHGTVGTVYLGNDTIRTETLDQYSNLTAALDGSLAPDGDILLYGCLVARNGTGQTFVGAMAEGTGADVAASDDMTGNAALGGDWTLEYAVGTAGGALDSVDVGAFTAAEMNDYGGILAPSFTSSNDGGDNPLSGIEDPDGGVITGDFDTDGDVDVLGYDNSYSTYTFYENDGSGTFTAVTGTSNPFDGIAATDIFYNSNHVYTGDFDNDGDLDIWDYEGSGAGDGTSIYLENTDGSTYTSSLSGGNNPLSGVPDPADGVTVGDFDTDGDIDILGFDDNSYSTYTFYENDGSGTFTAVTGTSNPFDGIAATDIFNNPANVYTADFDNDGDLDIWDYEGSAAGDGTSTYLENTDGSTYTSSLSGGNNPLNGVPDPADGITVGDFDTDGDIDVLGYDDGNYNSYTFYENDGSGTFTATTGGSNPFDGIAATDIFDNPANVYTADFDNDGDLDIWDYVGSAAGDGTSIYLEQLDSPPTIISSTPTDGATGVSVGDNVVITFDESVQLGSGSIELRQASDDMAVVSVTLSSGSVAGGDGSVSLSTTNTADDTLTIDPESNLPGSTDLYVHVDPTALSDTADGASALSLDDTPSTLNFETGTANNQPTVDLDGDATPGNGVTTAFDEATHQGTSAADGVRVAPTAVFDDSDGTVDQISLTLDNAQGDSGEQLSLGAGDLRGAVTGAGSGTTLTLVRNGASETDLRDTLRNVRYQNGDDDPTTGTDRTISVDVTDDAGATATDADTATITVSGTNDAPTLSATGNDPTFTEDGAAVSLYSSTSADAVESGQNIRRFDFTVTNVADGNDEVINLDGSTITLTDGSSGTTTDNSMDYAVSLSDTTATVTVTGFSVSTATFESRINGISYKHNNDDPTTGSDRVVTLTALTDDGGTGNGGNDDTALSIASTVTVEAVNDAPSITIGSDQSIGATTTEQSVTDFATGFDPIEAGQSISNFDVTNDNNGLFTAQPDISNSGDLTYTPANGVSDTATVSVQVVDDGGTANGGDDTATIQTFAITVDNMAPGFSSSATAAIDEGTTGTVLDVEAGDDGTTSPDTNVDYTLGGPDAAPFSIDSNGQLTLDSPQDFESPSDEDGNGDYDLTVTAIDDAGNTNQQTVTVSIGDVNEAPGQPSDSDGAVDAVAEGATNGATVGIDADTTDPEGDMITWSLIDDAGGRFQVDTSGVVTVADTSQLDFETTTSHDITIQAGDGSLSTTRDFSITVTDSDESPTFTSGTSASVAETATDGTTVSDVNANVGGSDDEGVSYRFTNGNGDGAYAIDATGQITVSDASAIDYESSTERTVTVEASEGAQSTTQDITITVTDADESPAFTSGMSDTIAEDAADGDLVHDVDADVGGDSDEAVSYTITDGNGAGAFTIDGSTGQIDVADKSQFDHEGTNSFSLTVAASEGTATTTQTILIVVADVDETPTFTSGTSASVAETATDGTAITDVNANVGGATDAGVGYALTSGNSDTAYAIDDSGQITVDDASAIDYEQSTERTVTVEASEGAQSATQDITIIVTDVDESPTFTSDTSDAIAEDAVNGDPVHDVNANVGGASDEAVSYTITAGNGAGAFTIDGSTGRIDVADSTQFNYEGRNSFSLTIEASEGTATNTRTVSISVTDVNDAPTDIGLSSAAVAQSGGSNVVVGTLSITDEDDTTATYSLVSGAGDDNNSAFTIANGDLVATDAANLGEDDYDVRIEADDGSGGTVEEAFTVAVTDDVSPTVVASTPSDDATDVDDDTNITVTFSELVAFDSGTLTLRKADSEGNFTDTETFDVESDTGSSDGNVSVSGTTVTVNPTGDLSRRTTYAVRIDAGALVDTAATPNDFGGIADDETLNFTIEAPRSRGGGGGGGGGDDSPTETSESSEPTVLLDSTSESDRERSNVTVSDAEAGTPVTITFEAADDTTNETESESRNGAGRNVSLSQLVINTTTGGDFTLNVTTSETRIPGTGTETEAEGPPRSQNVLDGLGGDERAFALGTGARSVGTVIVDHSVADEDIDDVTFTFQVRKTYFESLGVTVDSIALYRDESTRWNRLSTTLVEETETQYVFSATSPGLSTFRIGSSVPLFEVTDARVSQSHIEPGAAVDVTVTVANRGGANGTYDAVLRANGDAVATNAVDVPAGSERTVTITSAFATDGDYVFTIGNTSAGTVSVITPQVSESPTESPTESLTGTPADGPAGFPLSVILLLVAIAVFVGGTLVWSRR